MHVTQHITRKTPKWAGFDLLLDNDDTDGLETSAPNNDADAAFNNRGDTYGALFYTSPSSRDLMPAATYRAPVMPTAT